MRSWFRSLLVIAPLTAAALPAQADYLVGIVAYERGDYATAYRELNAPGTRDAAAAQLYLGQMHLFGKGVESDPAKGLAMLEEAAEADLLEAVVMLAQAYEFGMGAPKDKAKALQYWEQAAELGLPKAQVEMGLRYESGEVTGTPDYENALKWYRAATAANNAAGMTYLGSLYERGLGVEQDVEHARELYRQAAAKGHALGMNKLAQLIIAEGGDLDEAQALVETALRREGQPIFNATLAKILELKGDIAGAEAQYREAAKKSPLYVAPREALGDLYWSQGREDEAEAAWKQALEVARKAEDRVRLEEKLKQATF